MAYSNLMTYRMVRPAGSENNAFYAIHFRLQCYVAHWSENLVNDIIGTWSKKQNRKFVALLYAIEKWIYLKVSHENENSYWYCASMWNYVFLYRWYGVKSTAIPKLSNWTLNQLTITKQNDLMVTQRQL